MPKAVITRLRDLVRSLEYVVTAHAVEELEDDNLTILDLENTILTGQIVERQKDAVTRENKYVIRGFSRSGQETEVVVKIGATGKLIVITIYAA